MCGWRWEPVSRRGLRASWEGAAVVCGAGDGRAGKDSLAWWLHNYYCVSFSGTTTSSSAPPLQFSGAGELFHLEQVVSLLEGFHETPTSPLAVLPSFLSSLPLSLASYFTPCLFTVVLSSFFPFFPSL